MSHTVSPEGHSLILRKWEFWEMVGGNTLSSHVIKMKRAARGDDPARFKASRYLCEHQQGQKHSEKRLNV